jgi:hypothetical protein
MQRRHFLKYVALVTGSATAPAALIAGEPTPDANHTSPSTRSSHMSNANEIVVSYIAAWNETDARKRRDLVSKTWTDGGIYVDAHRRGNGHASIDAMIEKAQKQFPGYRVRLVSKIEAHNGYIRFSWAAGGTEQAPLYLGGTDFAVAANDGRLQSVTGFVDAAPAPAVA